MLINRRDIGGKLREVLINDKRFEPARLQELLKNDMYNLLINYLEIEPNDIRIKVEVENGNYVLRCKVSSRRVKIMGILPMEGI